MLEHILPTKDKLWTKNLPCIMIEWWPASNFVPYSIHNFSGWISKTLQDILGLWMVSSALNAI